MEIQKAYKLTVNNIADEPWHYDNIIVYAESAGQAKAKGLSEFDLAEIKDLSKKPPYRTVTFLDVKATRIKSEDKIRYKDKWLTKEQLNQIKWVEKRDNQAKQIWTQNPNGIAVVYNGIYNAYWGPNKCGYTSNIENAGKYSTQEAFEIVKGSDYNRQEKVILIDKEIYNTQINEKIQNLKNSLI